MMTMKNAHHEPQKNHKSTTESTWNKCVWVLLEFCMMRSGWIFSFMKIVFTKIDVSKSFIMKRGLIWDIQFISYQNLL